ncbi:hypothetical protein ACFLTA_02425 [Bacteroidota bacterium]
MYNIEPGIGQLRKDLEKVSELQIEALKILERVQHNGERMFTSETFPEAEKVDLINMSISELCLSLITCCQYARNQARLSKIRIHNLVSLALEKKDLGPRRQSIVPN